jgi:preprotein translocase subunit SecA
VTDGKVVTLNQSTGEPEPGRRYTQGIHQAIEAEERLEITVETRPAARISVQAFFDQYRLLAGLSATATDSAGELRRECDLRVVPIAPRQQRLQTRLPGRLFASGKEKLAAIVEEAGSMHRQGRPVLIGVCSHASLSELPSLLSSAGIPHQLFHGDGSTQDWEIWAQAGNQGRVTICTDVAWESSIKLGPEVAALGGLHVIAGEPHESRRLDRELLDQCACGGDPGTFRQYGALDDPLLREKRGALRGWVDRLVDAGLLARLFHVFQRRLQRRDAAARRKLRSYDRRRQKWLAYLGLDPCLD